MVASDRISTYDVVHPTPIPDKGKVLTGLSVFWFERTAAHRPEPPHLRHRRRARRGRAAARCACKRLEMLPVECVVRGYITGSGWKDYQAHRRGLGHRAAGRACRSPSSCPSRSSRPSTKAEEGHDEAIDFDAGRRARRRPASWRSSCATSRSRSTRSVADARARARRDPRRHEVRVRPRRRRRRSSLGDEVLHARLLALLAGRRLRGRAAASRRFDKQYVRDWASGTGWDKTPPAPRDPRRRRRRARASATSRPTSSSPASRSPPGWSGRRREGARPDPAQGRDPRPAGPGGRARAAGARLRGRRATSTSAGWSSSTSRTRRSSPAMCEQLLANPLIEDYEIVDA